MARFSRALTAALTQPSYQQGLANVGMLGGAFSSNRGQVQDDMRKERAAQGLMSSAAAMDYTDPNRAMAQLTADAAHAGIDPKAAQADYMQRLKLHQAAQATQKAQQQGQSLYVTAMQMGVPEPLSRLALDGQMDGKTFIDTFVKPAYQAKQPGATGVQGGIGVIRTGEGNEYSVNRNKDGSVAMVPIGAAPEFAELPPKEQKDYQYIQTRQFGETADQRQARDTTTKRTNINSANFGEIQGEALGFLSDSTAAEVKLERGLQLLEQVATGGPINNIATALEQTFGVVSGDKAELAYILGTEMYKTLKPLFGGVISEGEREAVERIMPNLKKGNAGNVALVQRMLEEVKSARQRAREIAGYGSWGEYKQGVLEASESKTVNWEDL